MLNELFTESALKNPPLIKLSLLRKIRHLTQVEMAKRMHTTQDQISRLEARKDSKLTTITKYLKATGASNIELVVEYADGETIHLNIENLVEP